MKPVVLIIRDGWGISKKKQGDAFLKAKTPVTDNLLKFYPKTVLKASGKAVGLPWKNIGSSEVGHLTIGAGRVIVQDLVRINKAIRNGEFFRNETILNVIKEVKENDSRLHLMGLLSDGGVHSNTKHLFALLKLAKRHKVKCFIHCFLDGRDVAQKSASKYLQKLQKKMKRFKNAEIATLIGRYYAMDRDTRWHREKKAYEAMVNGKGSFYPDFETAIQESYNKGITDEFFKPVVLNKEGVVKADDGLIFFNFRSDRARQLTKAFVEQDFKGFKRNKVKNLHFVSLTQYSSDLDVDVAFPIIDVKNTLGDTLSKEGFKQLRIAETEKYAHVTYFFNGLREEVLDRETRILIPSPKVSTYDLKPDMSIQKITRIVLEAINKDQFDFIVLNFANEDMIGHTGNFEAAVKASEAVDKNLGLILKAIKDKSGTLVMTADHGNIEEMITPRTKEPNTAHTTNKVRFVLVSNHVNLRNVKLRKGSLADVAPTILKILRINKPAEMTGKNLLKNKNI